MKKYEIIREIGDGTYGIVYEGINKENNQKVAIKRLKQKYKSLEECLSKIEVKVLEKLNHENIVQLKEVIRDKKGQVSYIFEYCDCNLYEFIESHKENKKYIPEPVIREIVFQIARGMKYMHSNQYFHRDLKPENILIILNNYNLNNMISGEIKVKICDFGTAKEIAFNNNLPMTQYVCTRWYRPPECVLRNDYYDEKMDTWAIGCIMAELYNLSAIFPGENEFDQLNQILKILGTPTRRNWPWGYYQTELLGIQLPIYYKKDFKKILGHICKEGVSLLNEIFTFDPTKRPSCIKILNHPYFRTIPKPKISINPNSLRTSTKNNNYKIKTDTINSYSQTKKKSYHLNNRTNNSSRNKIEMNEIRNENSINKKNISLSKNNNNIKRTVTQKASRNNIELNSNKNILKIKIKVTNNKISTKDIKNNSKTNFKNMAISTTEKKMKNANKYVKINEIKSGLVTKKRYTRNNEESKINDKNNEDKKELIIHRIERIGRNEGNLLSFNEQKKFSFIYNTKGEDKEESINKSIDIITNVRKTFSSSKNKLIKNIEEDSKINDIKKYKNYKIINIVYNDNKNQKVNINKDNINRKNINKYYNTKLINPESNYERNSENNNNKLLLRTKNLNFYKNKCKNNHKFYISKYNNLNNQKYKINNNHYKNNEKNSGNSSNRICTCSLGKNYSAKRNLIYNQDLGHSNKNNYNIRIIEYFKENKTPKNNKTKDYYRSIPKSPVKKYNNINSLFSSFINSKTDEGKALFGKRESKTKGNNSTMNIHYQSGIKKNNYNYDKRKINNLKIEMNEENSNFYINKIKNHIPNSTSKKENY